MCYRLLILLLLLLGCTGYAQNVDSLRLSVLKNRLRAKWESVKSIKDEKPFVATGGANLDLRSYNAYGIADRQAPFMWTVGLNFNAKIYGRINLPFSALINGQSQAFSQPFHPGGFKDTFDPRKRLSRIGASPYYKWAKLHLGYRNMTFSPMTLANHTFLGVGLELTPGKLRFGAMYGRLAKAEPLDLSLLQPNLPVFQRIGGGLKVGYGTASEYVDLIYFQAKDDLGSIPTITDSTKLIFAQQNQVWGMKGQKALGKRLKVSAEVVSSALTRNTSDALNPERRNLLHPDFLIPARASTEYRRAMDAAVNYSGSRFGLGLQYKRVDPQFKTLGAYFFNNDIENITVNFNTALFKQRVQITSTGGTQRNNLDGSKATTTTRLIGSANISYAAKKFNCGLNYSNYTTDIAYVLNQNADSLNAVIVSQDAGFNATYALSASETLKQNLTATLNAQIVTDDVEDPSQSSGSQMLTGNIGYSLDFPKSKTRIAFRANYNQNELSQIKTSRSGVGLTFNQSFLKDKLAFTSDVNYFLSGSSGGPGSRVINGRASLSTKLGKHHTLNLNLILLSRNMDSGSGTFTELTGTFGYGFNF